MVTASPRKTTGISKHSLGQPSTFKATAFGESEHGKGGPAEGEELQKYTNEILRYLDNEENEEPYKPEWPLELFMPNFGQISTLGIKQS